MWIVFTSYHHHHKRFKVIYPCSHGLDFSYNGDLPSYFVKRIFLWPDALPNNNLLAAQETGLSVVASAPTSTPASGTQGTVLFTSSLRLACLYKRMATMVMRQKHTLPSLPYDYNALEPVISAEIMTIHHQKHHATYVNNLNTAEGQLKEATDKGDIETIIKLQPVIQFNGGGHINHSIFWESLTPDGHDMPTGDLLEVINRDFGSFDTMKKYFTSLSIGIQGSGWGWLGYNPPTGRLRMTTCANQDPLEPTTGLIPIFGIDVWEHAYYLQYKNVRADYVNALFQIINWQYVAKRYADAVMRS